MKRSWSGRREGWGKKGNILKELGGALLTATGSLPFELPPSIAIIERGQPALRRSLFSGKYTARSAGRCAIKFKLKCTTFRWEILLKQITY